MYLTQIRVELHFHSLINEQDRLQKQFLCFTKKSHYCFDFSLISMLYFS